MQSDLLFDSLTIITIVTSAAYGLLAIVAPARFARMASVYHGWSRRGHAHDATSLTAKQSRVFGAVLLTGSVVCTGVLWAVAT